MIGPIDLLGIIAIVGAMLHCIFILQSRIVRRQAGPTRVDLGQPGLGISCELAALLIFAVPIGLIFLQGPPQDVPLPPLKQEIPPPEDLRARQIRADLLTRGVPHGLFIASVLAAHLFGVRPGRRELAEHGLIEGGWKLRRWDTLEAYSWTEGPPPELKLDFEGDYVRTIQVPPHETSPIDALLRGHVRNQTTASAE